MRMTGGAHVAPSPSSLMNFTAVWSTSLVVTMVRWWWFIHARGGSRNHNWFLLSLSQAEEANGEEC